MEHRTKAILIPLDSRPVSVRLPVSLGESCGWKMSVPPMRLLGGLHEPADFGGIESWLFRGALVGADTLFAAMDLLNFGGLVFSRDGKSTTDEAMRRGELLRKIKKAFPRLKIHAFGVVLRDSITVRSAEDFKLWKKLSSGGAEYPEWFLKIRERNHAMNRALIDLAAEGVVESAVLGKEDTAPGNPFAHEVEALKRHAAKSGAGMKVTIINGTDEIPLLMMSGRFCADCGVSPVFLVDALNGDFLDSTPIFESRPIRETLKQQARLAGGSVVSRGKHVIRLLLHTPKTRQADLFAMQIKAAEKGGKTPQKGASEPMYRHIISQITNATTQVAVADLAFANGADPELVKRLIKGGIFFKPVAYAGWNTASNTLGTVVALAAAAHARQASGVGTDASRGRIHVNLMSERLIDDYLYQSVIRPELIRRTGQHHFIKNAAKINALFQKLAEGEIRCLGQEINDGHDGNDGNLDRFRSGHLEFDEVKATLPWSRLFDGLIEFKVKARAKVQ